MIQSTNPLRQGDNLNASQFKEIKNNLPENHRNMLIELKSDFPNISEHVIYNLMKKMDFTKNLVVSQLKFKKQLNPNPNTSG